MRVLSSSEARVVRVLIARDRLRSGWPSGEPALPRRTVQTIRQRAYERGWVTNRFIPDPTVFGVDRLTIALASPLADRASELVEAWAARPECLHLWASEEAVLGFFASRPPHSRPLTEILRADGLSQITYTLHTPCRATSVPAYFDFEAAWVRAVGLPGLFGYPRPFVPRRPDPGAPPGPGPSASHQETVARMVRSSFEPRTRDDASPGEGRIFWPRSEDRCLRRGWVTFRTFLDPIALASTVEGLPGWVAVVHGRLIPPHRPDELFRALVGECGVGPFLFASDEREVLFATFSSGPATRQGGTSTGVFSTVQRFLQGIAVVRWPWMGTRVPVNHRYDRLLWPVGRPASPEGK